MVAAAVRAAEDGAGGFRFQPPRRARRHRLGRHAAEDPPGRLVELEYLLVHRAAAARASSTSCVYAARGDGAACS